MSREQNKNLQLLGDIVGERFVSDNDQILYQYSRTTLASNIKPHAVVWPQNSSEIKKIVQTANLINLTLYPISRGRNWGYGSACAPREGQIILDLSRMNKILEVNEPLAYAVIEPGVTQIQMYEYLKEKKLPLWLDCTGSGPDASIVGNTLERGFGHTPYGDHFMHSCSMEIILGDGRELKTGFGHYKGAKTAHVFKYGIGPYLDGLFTQSNYGIITKLGIWLMPEPECCSMFYCAVPKKEDISSVIETLRPLKLNGQIKSLIHIGNDLRVFSSFNQYPWKKANHQTPLSDNLSEYFRKQGKFGAWNISGAVYGSTKQVKNNKAELRKALRGLGKIQFAGDKTIACLHWLSKIFSRFQVFTELQTKFKSVEKVYGLLKGTPTDAFLFGTLWRVKKDITTETIDPLDYNAGMMWISPILPMTGLAANHLIKIVNPIFKQYGFEPLITVSLITERAMVSVITISYDRDNCAETQQAQACYDALFEKIMAAGYPPYRTNIFTMKKLAQGSEGFWEVTKTIKDALDPNNIIAPGRYQPFDLED
ncbi:FAD-binding oxidoreductase [Desulfobacter latus]|uniref:FAD-binding oxidoreductase n=1 Tax=Desulfobacter latus TaxID=2292 RepID=A0A850TEX9_9BACT|nr:FAD-binding oxidoreductase [Desulfobacter latus]NWH06827.1 FAD-binding oxidoreductase [Desulfobacter latus]